MSDAREADEPRQTSDAADSPRGRRSEQNGAVSDAREADEPRQQTSDADEPRHTSEAADSPRGGSGEKGDAVPEGDGGRRKYGPLGKVLVIIPTYNEAENIKPIVARVRESVPEAHVLVADDNSPDGTGKVADELAAEDDHVRVLH
ncbi:glycosyltransferase, partial [Streptomyces sp. MCAF7]